VVVGEMTPPQLWAMMTNYFGKVGDTLSVSLAEQASVATDPKALTATKIDRGGAFVCGIGSELALM
jgi:hypothetical protein